MLGSGWDGDCPLIVALTDGQLKMLCIFSAAARALYYNITCAICR